MTSVKNPVLFQSNGGPFDDVLLLSNLSRYIPTRELLPDLCLLLLVQVALCPHNFSLRTEEVYVSCCVALKQKIQTLI